MATEKEIGIEEAIDIVNDLTPKEKEDIKKWIREGKSIELLVTGKTGTGKSSLLNFLLGKIIFEVGENKYESCTSKVHFKESEKNGIKIRAWDSPGLQDGTGDEKYLEDMKQKCTKINLLLYCISMEELRSDLHVHKSAILQINTMFGKQCWKNTVFVITFANARIEILKAKGTPECKLKTKLEERIKQWREAIQESLRSMDVDKKIVDSILVVPAGHTSELHLPGYRYWISNVWSQCLLSMTSPAQSALIQMESQAGSQGGFIPEPDATEDAIGPIRADERKIVFTRAVKVSMGIAAGGIVASGATIGAVIGGMIGTLAIGIPTFGVAAGAGLGIGAAVGGAIGSSIAVGVGAFISLYRKRMLNRQD